MDAKRFECRWVKARRMDIERFDRRWVKTHPMGADSE
jgi:hypothetical protein